MSPHTGGELFANANGWKRNRTENKSVQSDVGPSPLGAALITSSGRLQCRPLNGGSLQFRRATIPIHAWSSTSPLASRTRFAVLSNHADLDTQVLDVSLVLQRWGVMYLCVGILAAQPTRTHRGSHSHGVGFTARSPSGTEDRASGVYY